MENIRAYINLVEQRNYIVDFYEKIKENTFIDIEIKRFKISDDNYLGASVFEEEYLENFAEAIECNLKFIFDSYLKNINQSIDEIRESTMHEVNKLLNEKIEEFKK